MSDLHRRQLLSEYCEKRMPCEVSCQDATLVVYVSSVGTDIAITRRVHAQRTKLSGWWAIRLSAIANLRCPTDADQISAAMSAYNQRIPPKLPFKAKTMRDLATRVCDFFSVVILNGKSTVEDSDGIAGTIVDLTETEIHLREISTKYRWVPGIRSINLSDVEYVLFGSDYEKTLTETSAIRDLFG